MVVGGCEIPRYRGIINRVGLWATVVRPSASLGVGLSVAVLPSVMPCFFVAHADTTKDIVATKASTASSGSGVVGTMLLKYR